MRQPLRIAALIDSIEFTPGVVRGDDSLGGSESACVGLMRALAKRGHDVTIFTTQIADDALGPDQAGVTWRHAKDLHVLNQYAEWDVVVSLRSSALFAAGRVNARYRILWSEDLLVPGAHVSSTMAAMHQVDEIAYVSEFHRQQWEELQPDVKGFGWVTRNGYDPRDMPGHAVKDPDRIIHISRPERGLKPLLAMWPKVREAYPSATLAVCRYNSMYDPTGWAEVCKSFDDELERVDTTVGGITYLGELGKAALYEQIARSAVMWYPGIASFAETGCIAAIEALANGTPFVGSYKGALPETAAPSDRAGLLIPGDADEDEAYQTAAIAAVTGLLADCKRSSRRYRDLQAAGRAHALPYRYDVIAEEWETHLEDAFEARYRADKPGILRALLHEDDHVAALQLANTLGDLQTVDFCHRVIDGKDQGADHYGKHALPDPLWEAEHSPRFATVADHFIEKHATHVLDVACGNGSFALCYAQKDPAVRIHGLDYSPLNIERATKAAKDLGVADRVTFQLLTVYDFDRHVMSEDWATFSETCHEAGTTFDGLFCGEFLEHVANTQAVVDGLEQVLASGAGVVYSCPSGNCIELIDRHVPVQRGHVHRFATDDLQAVFGAKAELDIGYLGAGGTAHGLPFGNWMIAYRHLEKQPTGVRPIDMRIRRTRPYARLSVGLITKNAEADLARCLESVWPIADEIVVGDTGSTDRTRAIAEEYGARVIDVAPVDEQPDGFAGARNAVLDAAEGEWFHWIDADEQLIGHQNLRPYLETTCYRGFALHQNHLSVDLPRFFDKPIRVFRNDGTIRFFGCIHEQPGDGDPNTNIMPAMELVSDVEIAHIGYIAEPIRRHKMFQRNLPLLVKDRKRFPERRLGLVLVLRDYTNIANADRELHGGRMTTQAYACYKTAIDIFDKFLADPADQLHEHARPWYENAIRNLTPSEAYEVELTLAGTRGGMEKTSGMVPTRERVWVRTSAELKRLVDYRLEKIAAKMEPPGLHVDPFPAQRLGEALEEQTA